MALDSPMGVIGKLVTCLWEGTIGWSGDTAAIAVETSKGVVQTQQFMERKTRTTALPSQSDAVGHCVVHGGPQHADRKGFCIGGFCWSLGCEEVCGASQMRESGVLRRIQVFTTRKAF